MTWHMLMNIKLICLGYDIEDCNVTAIARLRGNSLKTFNIPFRCIGVYNPEAEEGLSSSRLYVNPDFGEKVDL